MPMPTFANAPPTLLPRDQLLDIKMEIATATLVAATGVVLVMVVALVLFAVLPGIRPRCAQKGKRNIDSPFGDV